MELLINAWSSDESSSWRIIYQVDPILRMGVMQGAPEYLQAVIVQYLESVLDLVRAFVMTRDGADWRR